MNAREGGIDKRLVKLKRLKLLQKSKIKGKSTSTDQAVVKQTPQQFDGFLSPFPE